jgi:4-hydroxybenzoate polyprenyltransferase
MFGIKAAGVHSPLALISGVCLRPLKKNMDSNAAQPPFLLRLAAFIRFSHTVFALPFGLIAMLVAGSGRVSASVFGWIVVCTVAARTLAMCFNRLMDWEIDKLNPRTEGRHRLIAKPHAWIVLLFSTLLAVFSAAKLNSLCLALSPLMLLILCFYSLTKRFTAFSHLFLGLALAVAPVGAWVAVRGKLLELPPLLLGGAVLCWTFGFDLIYSTLDTSFDREQKLFSFPSRYGIPAALRLARLLHMVAVGLFWGFGHSSHLGSAYAAACLLAVAALFWEHRLAETLIPERINQAFFQINAFVSLVFLTGTLVEYRVWELLQAVPLAR